MKIKLLIIALLCCDFTSFGQFGEQQIIDNVHFGFYNVEVVDFNNNGFADIISYDVSSNQIEWFENLDGEGNFSGPIAIMEPEDGIEKFALEDIDLDGDLDVIFFTNYLDKIAWIENLGDATSFGPIQIITEDYYTYKITMHDVDGDNYPDLMATLSVSGLGESWVWFKNNAGSGFSSELNFIEATFPSQMEFLFKDLDDDGDTDMLIGLSPGLQPGVFLWYENLDGLGNFGEYQKIYQFDYFASDVTRIRNLSFADIDGDLLEDLVFSTEHDDFGYRIHWMRNLGGVAIFGPPNLVENPPGEHIRGLNAVDVDNDNDLDLVYGLAQTDEIGWYRNWGTGHFSERILISNKVNGLRNTTTAFVDSDNLVDVVSISFSDSKLAWYKNLEPLSVNSNLLSDVFIYPNPTNGVLTIESSIAIKEIQVSNTLGQNIAHFKDTNNIDLTHLTSGIYILRITDQNGAIATRRIVIN